MANSTAIWRSMEMPDILPASRTPLREGSVRTASSGFETSSARVWKIFGLAGAGLAVLGATVHYAGKSFGSQNQESSLRSLTNKSIRRTPPARLQLWQSAKSDTYFLAKKDDLLWAPDFSFTGPVVQISNATGQTITGFGGAFTEASGLVFQKLTPAQQTQLINDYFGPVGNGYTLGRTHINSCDFSVGSYSFDDVEGDVDLLRFDEALTRDTEALIPLIKAAQSALEKQGWELKLLATPWSPPAWMKNNGQMDQSDRPCLKDGMAGPWAKYFTKWISAYQAHGIPIWAVTVQNEPENNATWEACVMTAEEEADFLGKYLGPELRSSHPNVSIFVMDHNKDHVYDYAKTILSDKVASQYADGVAYHWYAGDGFDELRKIQDEFPKATLLASEATWEAYRWKTGTTLAVGDWSFGEGYGHDIIGDLNTGSVGWIDWNLILNEIGGPNHVNNVCDSAIQVSQSLGEVYYHPQYWYIGHFSRFIIPGSVRLQTDVKNTERYGGSVRPYGTCTSEDGLQATAFRRPDGKVVVVAMHCGDEPVEFKLQRGSQAVLLELPPHAIQTYLFDDDDGVLTL
ncbi:unnamed protein product [Polarella glacialis]|uniref:Glucosylceramidase n=1 Tax=Polarella glacialis TaxID=89957 RepID=A0A813HJE2_POLGL|nr:unnamed protein product [Polarella glacialis]